MDERLLCICDTQSAYVDRLVSALQKKENCPFSVRGFTSVEAMGKCLMHESPQIVLLSEGLEKSAARGRLPPCTLLLTEQYRRALEPQYIYKYQSATSILENILKTYCERSPDAMTYQGSRLTQVVLYFSFDLGREAANRKKAEARRLKEGGSVLYIDLHPTATDHSLFCEGQGDIIDLLYYVRRGEGVSAEQLCTMVGETQGLSFLPVGIAALTYSDIAADLWQQLIAQVARLGVFDYLAISMGPHLQGYLNLLRQCDRLVICAFDEAEKEEARFLETVLYQRGDSAVVEKVTYALAPEDARAKERCGN